MDIATAIGQVRRHATDVGHLDKLWIKMSFVSSYPPRVGLAVVVIVIKLRKVNRERVWLSLIILLSLV